MRYDDFVSSVQVRGGRPRDETDTLVHATLRVLAERLTAGEADDRAHRDHRQRTNWMEES